MQVVRKTITRYKCGTCGTSYSNKKETLRCEAKPTEQKVFKVGERVCCLVVHTCKRHPRDFNFNPVGKVDRILGPEPTDRDYEARHIGERVPDRNNSHVWLYQVESCCPKCHGKRSIRFYGPEFAACE